MSILNKRVKARVYPLNSKPKVIEGIITTVYTNGNFVVTDSNGGECIVLHGKESYQFI